MPAFLVRAKNGVIASVTEYQNPEEAEGIADQALSASAQNNTSEMAFVVYASSLDAVGYTVGDAISDDDGEDIFSWRGPDAE